MSRTPGPSIDQLSELGLPAMPASYWPQTWGWLALLGVVVVVLGALATWRYLHWRRNRYRREALACLASLEQAVQDPARRLAALREIPPLLKRVALSMPDGARATGLRDAQWQAFLQRHSSKPLPASFAQHLALLAYAPADRLMALADEEVQAMLNACRQWIEVHHVAA
ncbi:DUF4381 domain-containing protein [Pseudomonas guariconensis]|jgi:hypothetical protein|uniref:DUF4381 domain-containing protein n=1 Tax=Pseudomonas guariconensis TaxID=1288410 RepID=UPI002D1F37A3|nr:DUF4381 domain-containing protein [Pseudomonas guariconensis]MEB3841149.1 DUF4381 domain-containing protein [Pseudomonas guariconensis]MEB3874017.1 DUF4381 domain-containing protein [Pseudomonas guariconensis]MEB3877553.1 DUF4381 domain-containing protein [Pseudomonas guariconensis]MEB3894003.1 DUF4381 domain-containing protein [Pseudomonas guariconensis]